MANYVRQHQVFPSIFSIGILFLLLAWHNNVYAAGSCTFSNPSTTLTTLPSPSIYNSSVQGQASAGMTCNLVEISLLSSSTITATVTSTTNSLNLLNTNGSGDVIPYMLFADQNYAHAMPIGTTIDYGSLNLLSIVIGVGTKTIPLYVKTAPGANISAGTYTDTISIGWTYNICTISALVTCINSLTGSGTSLVTINLIVAKSCIINTANSVDLGTNSFVSQFNPVTKTITLTCTKTEGYKTYFDNGTNYSSPWRQLRGSSGNYLQYQIYVPNTTTIWDNNNKQTGAGTGFTSNINFQVGLNSAQSEQVAGVYSDTVSFIVEY